MKPTPLRLPPPRILRQDQIDRIHQAAVRILLEQGIRVHYDPAREAAGRVGIRVDGQRVFPDRVRIDELVHQTRSRQTPHDPQTDREPTPAIWLSVPMYCEFVHDLETDTVAPFTTDSLIEATKLVDTMDSYRVIGSGPGIPHDVTGELQRLKQYQISARYSRHGWRPNVEESSARALPYLFEMAEALGHPPRSHVIYIISPLSLSRQSFEALNAVRDKIESIHVSDMISAGGTAPVRLGDALAMGAAEAMGAAIVVAEYARLPVQWSLRVCPFDPRRMALSLGSPEEFHFQRASDELNAWYHGRDPGPPNGMLHTQAKLPDAQAAAEKMSQMTLAAACGARHFSGAGALSLDEVFSAEQLVVDCEMRDHVERLVRGASLNCDPEAAAGEVAEGMDGGFLGMDSTARLYRGIYWLPRIFERRSFSGWYQAGMPRVHGTAREFVREQLGKHDFRLPDDVSRELDAIYARAEAAIVGG
jgi:trimethylamine--corrinoid protein Co-methyltransferase